jgi:hypothetical protein
MFVFPYIKDGERKTSGYCYCIRKNVLVVVTRRTYYYISWHVILIADRVHWLSWRRHVDRRETRMLAMNRYPTLRHFLFLKIFSFFFFFLLGTNMKRSPRVILTHDRYGFSSLLVLVLFFHLSAVVPFLFYELLLRWLSDIFFFFEEKTILSGTCKKKEL